MTYEQLLTTADQNGLLVKEKKLAKHDGLLKGKRIAIRKDIETQAEKSCVLAEELGHHYTSSGDILDQDNIMKQKQEYRARLYGYNLKIGLTGLIRAYEAGCRNLYEMADFLDSTEEYLKKAIQCYRSKYGVCTAIDNYVIYFEPFAVMRMITTN
nr:MAG TPA: IrrE protein [Caudoviricetes sp.]